MTSLKILKSKINSGNAGFLIGAMVLLASSFLAIKFVHKQFAGYDLSPIIDLSWRLANHQIPGTDFINTMPPLFIVLIKFISWGNLRWVDLTIINIIAICGTFLFLYLISDHREESIWGGLFIAIILALPLVYTNHIWPSSLAQLSGIIFFYSVYVAINSNHLSAKTLLSILLASGVLSISKQNVALPIMVTTIVFLLFSKHQNRFTLISFILLGAVSGVVLSMFYLGYSLDSFLYTYFAVMGRASVNINMLNVAIGLGTFDSLSLLTLGLGFLFFYAIYEKNCNISNINKIYFLLMLAASTIPIITDWDSKIDNISLPLFIFTTGILLSSRMSIDNSIASKDYQHHAPRILITFVVLLTLYFLSFLGGYLRESMMARGRDSFYEFNANAMKMIDQDYFSGLRTGKELSGVLHEIALAKDEFSHQKIFLGPCMEFGYLYTKSPSPHGMPLWWHPGTSYGVFDEKKIIDNFIQAQFDVLIFLKIERIGMPYEILNFIDDNYSKYDKYQYIDLYNKSYHSNLSTDPMLNSRLKQ